MNFNNFKDILCPCHKKSQVIATVIIIVIIAIIAVTITIVNVIYDVIIVGVTPFPIVTLSCHLTLITITKKISLKYNIISYI